MSAGDGAGWMAAQISKLNDDPRKGPMTLGNIRDLSVRGPQERRQINAKSRSGLAERPVARNCRLNPVPFPTQQRIAARYVPRSPHLRNMRARVRARALGLAVDQGDARSNITDGGSHDADAHSWRSHLRQIGSRCGETRAKRARAAEMSPAARALRSDVVRRAASRGGTLRCAEARRVAYRDVDKSYASHRLS
jgi:hypothetical protein